MCPALGHLVALVIAPGWDFHWYRKGPDGMWSHKPGQTPVTNVDNSGNPIIDPRTRPIAGSTPTSALSWWSWMAISNSPESWRATADVYSGRPNPSWDLPDAAADQLVAIWDESYLDSQGDA